MSNFKIIKENGRFSLYQDNVLINTYTRKYSAIRRMKKIQSAECTSVIEKDLKEIQVITLNNVKSIIFKGITQKLGLIYTRKLVKGKGFELLHALTQRNQRGAERAIARSPPLANRGGSKKSLIKNLKKFF